MRCGACCAFYRVSFDCHESDEFSGGVVPIALIIKLNKTQSAMRGTEKRPIRCRALVGNIGMGVHCAIYEKRPTICRLFLPAWQCNQGNSLCDQARLIYGMMPFSNF